MEKEEEEELPAAVVWPRGGERRREEKRGEKETNQTKPKGGKIVVVVWWQGDTAPGPLAFFSFLPPPNLHSTIIFSILHIFTHTTIIITKSITLHYITLHYITIIIATRIRWYKHINPRFLVEDGRVGRRAAHLDFKHLQLPL